MKRKLFVIVSLTAFIIGTYSFMNNGEQFAPDNIKIDEINVLA